MWRNDGFKKYLEDTLGWWCKDLGYTSLDEFGTNKHTRNDRSSPLRQDDVRGPVQPGHTSFIMQRLQIRQGNLTRSRALSLSLTRAHPHTLTLTLTRTAYSMLSVSTTEMASV